MREKVRWLSKIKVKNKELSPKIENLRRHASVLLCSECTLHIHTILCIYFHILYYILCIYFCTLNSILIWYTLSYVGIKLKPVTSTTCYWFLVIHYQPNYIHPNIYADDSDTFHGATKLRIFSLLLLLFFLPSFSLKLLLTR